MLFLIPNRIMSTVVLRFNFCMMWFLWLYQLS